jgi:hypothetical protein
MGAFDLYGQYYENSRDAHNAEDAQCAAIDARLATERADQSESYLYSLLEGQHWEIVQLTERVAALEAKLSESR